MRFKVGDKVKFIGINSTPIFEEGVASFWGLRPYRMQLLKEGKEYTVNKIEEFEDYASDLWLEGLCKVFEDCWFVLADSEEDPFGFEEGDRVTLVDDPDSVDLGKYYSFREELCYFTSGKLYLVKEANEGDRTIRVSSDGPSALWVNSQFFTKVERDWTAFTLFCRTGRFPS